MPAFARRLRPPLRAVRALPAALVLAAASLAASRAQADAVPTRPFTQVHLDFYLLFFSGATLGSVAVNTKMGPLKGSDIGVAGVETAGVPFVAPPSASAWRSHTPCSTSTVA